VADSPGGLDDQWWYDQWRKPDGDVVLLPCSSRELYARLGWTLLQARAWDYRQQMQADWRATQRHGIETATGSAVFPAP
jgi:hypothetical protein